MPIVKIDLIFDVVRVEVLKAYAGKRWVPTNTNDWTDVQARWCGQCRLEAECGIKARYEMILALHNNSFIELDAKVILKNPNLRPKEWVIQANGQPRCEAMQLIGSVTPVTKEEIK